MTLRAISEVSSPRYEPGTYDLRSWEVRVRRGDDRVGVIDDVLVDERGRTRYLDVALEDIDRHVLIPSGQAEAEEDERIVWLSGVSENQLSDIPAYEHDPAAIDRDYERSLISAYDRPDTGTDYYDRPDFAASWGRGKSATGSGKLVRLDQLDDIDVARGDTDPRGLRVVGAGDEELGKVHHLIGDVDAMKVRYLTVKIDGHIAGGDREVLIPVGHVALEPEKKQVRAPALDRSRLLALPTYEGGEITREHERALTESFGEAYSDERQYHHPRYRYDRLYNRGATPWSAEASPIEPIIEPIEGVIVVRRWRLETGSGLAGTEAPSEPKRPRAAGRRR